MESPERLFWISMKHATIGIISRDGVIVAAPPIARWMVSKRLIEVKSWLLRQRAKVVEVTSS